MATTIPGPAAPPFPPIASESVPWKSWSEGERFGYRYRHLTSAAIGESYHVGVEIDELPPGKRSASAHYHMHEEEHLLVLEGSCTLRLGEERHHLKAGDYACFPAGQRAGHCLENEGTEVCRLLVIGERCPDEVAVHTDTGAVQIRALGVILDGNATRGYWDGEQTGG